MAAFCMVSWLLSLQGIGIAMHRKVFVVCYALDAVGINNTHRPSQAQVTVSIRTSSSWERCLVALPIELLMPAVSHIANIVSIEVFRVCIPVCRHSGCIQDK